MKKKLRLLVTKKCNRTCAGCCNKQYELDKLPVIDIKTIAEYDEIMITGGEPMLFPNELINLIDRIKMSILIEGHLGTKIYLYTAMPSVLTDLGVLDRVDGIQLTLHDISIDEAVIFSLAPPFIQEKIKDKSYRLCVFPELKHPIIIHPNVWNSVRFMNWIKDCPLPSDEVFYRIENLW